MASKALLIRDAVIARLSSPALAGIGAGGVVNDPDYAFDASDLPAIAVYLKNGSANRDAVIGHIDRRLTLTMRVIGKGSEVTSIDGLLVAAHQRLTSYRDIGGLAYDIEEGDTVRDRDVLQFPAAYTEIDFSISYRTNETSLE